MHDSPTRRTSATTRVLFSVIVGAALLALAPGVSGQSSPTGIQRLVFEARRGTDVREVAVRVEVASTARQRAQGLMHRPRMPADRGLLMIWPQTREAGRTALTMANVRFPLTVAFLGPDGRIAQLIEMPVGREVHVARVRHRFALEMTRGFFAEHELRVGDRLIIPDAWTRR